MSYKSIYYKNYKEADINIQNWRLFWTQKYIDEFKDQYYIVYVDEVGINELSRKKK